MGEKTYLTKNNCIQGYTRYITYIFNLFQTKISTRKKIKMDAQLFKHLFRKINTLPRKNFQRSFSTSFKQTVMSILPSSSKSSQLTKDISRVNIESFLHLYSTSANLRQENTQKVERPESMDQQGRPDLKKPPPQGPVTWANLWVSIGTIGILMGAYYYTKAKKDAMREADRKKEIGKSKIGGTFNLIDQDGNPKKSEDYYGKWVLLYFGFTHCPDICPDEMEKMATVYDKLKELKNKKDSIVDDVVPLMITVDPERDGVSQMKEYCKEFHPELVGLTGSRQQITEACKAFRVYFSAGPRDDEDDYIVDHTIIIYLLDPEGQFVDYYGQTKTAAQVSASVQLQMAKYKSSLQKPSILESMKSSVSK